MSDMFSNWLRAVDVAMSMGRTGMRAMETISAANKVIAARTPIINAAVVSPLTGDHKELARMVPEKVEAFSRAGSVTVSGMFKAQAAWMAHMQHFGAMAMRGRFPTLPEMIDLNERGAAMMLEAVETVARTGSGALAPVHSKATANARRLRKKTPV